MALDTYLNLCTQVYELSKPRPPEDAYALYLDYANEANGLILEPMCGTGRFLIPLLEAGFNVQGFDASQHMLDVLQNKAKNKGINPNIWHGYIDDLKREEQYSLIFIPSGSFGLITDLEKARQALTIFYNQLADGGLLVFEVETLMAANNINNLWRGSVWRCHDGTSIIASFLDLPLINNIGNTICRYEHVCNNQIVQTEIEEIKVRLYNPDTQVDLLKSIGFQQVRMIKAFNKESAPNKNDELIIYECRK